MKVPRIYVQKYTVQDLGGQPIVLAVFSDMSNQELAAALAHFMEREDFEYCEALIGEADLRGITLNKQRSKKGS